MKLPARGIIRFVVAMALLGGAMASHAAMYKWIDEDGSVTYSNTPPVDRTKVKEFTKVEDIGTVPADKRPKDAHAGSEKRNADTASVKPDAATAKAETSASVAAPGSSRPLMLVGPDASTAKPEQTTRRDAEVVRSDTLPRAAASAQGLQPEAAQDPCLRSADPHCYQRNRDKYHPYLGYAPSARAAGASAVGASAAPAGTGAVGGQIGISPGPDKRAAPSAR